MPLIDDARRLWHRLSTTAPEAGELLPQDPEEDPDTASPRAEGHSPETRLEIAETAGRGDGRPVAQGRAAKRRRDLGVATLAGLAGGAILAADRFAKSPAVVGHSLLGRAAAAASSLPIFIQPRIGALATHLGELLPTAIGHWGEKGAYVMAALWGSLHGVPAESLSWFYHWQPGSAWPPECAAVQPPAPPLPAHCPNEGIAALQHLFEPYHVLAVTALWGAALGAGAGTLLLYTPLGRRLANMPHADKVAAVVTASVGALGPYIVQLAAQLPAA